MAIRFNVIEHVAEDARLTPLRLRTELPANAVAVPPQVLTRPLGVAICRPPGRLSVKLTPVRGDMFGFEIWNVRLALPFT